MCGVAPTTSERSARRLQGAFLAALPVNYDDNLHGTASAQATMVAQGTTLRFDRPIFTTNSAGLCPRQHHIAALCRALDDNDRAAFDRAAREGACKVVGPDIRLAVVARPGAYDPDVEVRVAGDAPGGEPGLPRGRVWTLKSMVRN